MKRRSKSSGEPAKARRPKAAKLKRTAAPKVASRSRAAAQGEVALLARELNEAREQQTATAGVLRMISGAPSDSQSILETIVRMAGELCASEYSMLFRLQDGQYHVACSNNAAVEYVEFFSRNPISVDGSSLVGRTALAGRAVHIEDCLADPDYKQSEAARLGRHRTMLGVPLLHDGVAIGVIGLLRTAVKPFTEKQIALVTAFADQAVIAIENARLLNELRQRTTDLTERTVDLTEALEQQTATSEVLQIISSSPGDLEPVFAAMLKNATRICVAKFGVLWLCEGKGFRCVALHDVPKAFARDFQRQPVIYPPVGSPLNVLAETQQVAHITDLAATVAYAQRAPSIVPAVELGGVRTLVHVPMVKRGSGLVGAITVFRQEVRPFADKEIALLQNFAAQAVIAIENVRLLNELRERTDDLGQRTADLTEALEQQTATSEVLGAISSSPGDLPPVFESMLENAVRICDATFGTIYRAEGEGLQVVATSNMPSALAEHRHSPQYRPAAPETPLSDVVATKAVVHVTNLAKHKGYTERRVPALVSGVEIGGVRTWLGVPMLKEGELIGAFVLHRKEVHPFSDKQIALVTNFAAQAVIAIENARLLSELRQRTDDLAQSLEQQTATSEVLHVISSSPGDLQPVFDTILGNATRLCEASYAGMWLCNGDRLRFVAQHGGILPETDFAQLRASSISLHNSDIPAARAIRSRGPVQVEDLREEPAYLAGDPVPVAAVEVAGCRTLVIVPMLKDDEPLGAIAVYRKEVRIFTDKQVALVENFAAQAVIAIENARLLNELRQRTDDLTRSLEDLRTTQDRLVQTQKLASLGQLTAGIAHEIKNPLNFVNNFSGVSVELIDELQEALQRVQADDKTRSEIGELADTLRDNLGKIVQHGRRADAIVKNMLLHSREGSGEHRLVNINALVEEALNLAYHGARAEQPDFAITLQRSFDPEAGQADVFPQDITRVLLNLIANGFYAAIKRTGAIASEGHEPTLAAATRSLGDRIEIGIRDNGAGIPPEVQEKMFNPFFTTKPAGEGTGLGLSISYDIVVKQHAGSIEVDTQPGEFTEIRIILPRSPEAERA